MEVDTFLFLAVLLGAMGAAHPLLLMVIDRRSKNRRSEQGLRTIDISPKKRSRDADLAERRLAQPRDEGPPQRPRRPSGPTEKAKKERSSSRKAPDRARRPPRKQAARRSWPTWPGSTSRSATRTEAEKSLVRKLADTRAAVTMSQAELDTRQSEIEKTRSEQEEVLNSANRCREALPARAALRSLAERKRSRSRSSRWCHTPGKQGSNRKPIFVELDNDEDGIFYPGKQRLSDTTGPRLSPDGAGADRLAHRGREDAELRPEAGRGPSPAVPGRPDGINALLRGARRGSTATRPLRLRAGRRAGRKFDFAEEKIDRGAGRRGRSDARRGSTSRSCRRGRRRRRCRRTAARSSNRRQRGQTFHAVGRSSNGGGGSVGGTASSVPGRHAIPWPPGSGGGEMFGWRRGRRPRPGGGGSTTGSSPGGSARSEQRRL